MKRSPSQDAGVIAISRPFVTPLTAAIAALLVATSVTHMGEASADGGDPDHGSMVKDDAAATGASRMAGEGGLLAAASSSLTAAAAASRRPVLKAAEEVMATDPMTAPQRAANVSVASQGLPGEPKAAGSSAGKFMTRRYVAPRRPRLRQRKRIRILDPGGSGGGRAEDPEAARGGDGGLEAQSFLQSPLGQGEKREPYSVDYTNMEKVIQQMRKWNNEMDKEKEHLVTFAGGAVEQTNKYKEYLEYFPAGFNALHDLHHHNLVPTVGEYLLKQGTDIKKIFDDGLKAPDVLVVRWDIDFPQEKPSTSDEEKQQVQKQLDQVEERSNKRREEQKWWIFGVKTCIQFSSNGKASTKQLQGQVEAWAKDFANRNKETSVQDLINVIHSGMGAKVVIRYFADAEAAKKATCPNELFDKHDRSRRIFRPAAVDQAEPELFDPLAEGTQPNTPKRNVGTEAPGGGGTGTEPDAQKASRKNTGQEVITAPGTPQAARKNTGQEVITAPGTPQVPAQRAPANAVAKKAVKTKKGAGKKKSKLPQTVPR